MQKKSHVKNVISWIFIIILIIITYFFYRKYNFNDFVKAEHMPGITKFERDSSNRLSGYDSYKISNDQYNDAMFYKTVDVVPNTSYKVSCRIKTEDVKGQNENSDSGAHICIADTVEKSNNVNGTSDWTDVSFYFNSKNRTKVDVGFRLGGVEDNCAGTAWFSDFKMQAGVADQTNTWNYLLVLFDNVDAIIEENGVKRNLKFTLSETDKNDMISCMNYFQNTISEICLGKMRATYDIVEAAEPIKRVSHDDENGYYVSGYDVREVLDPYIEKGIYDHIFIAFRFGDMNQSSKGVVNDWIGLGSMDYRNIGFSNIRLPDSDYDYVYKYDTRVNIFPEEVLIHEFLHTLERNALEYGEDRPVLHDFEKYGYTMQNLTGLKEWYKDYMNKEILTSSGKIGLPADIYTKKPAKTSDFTYSHELKVFEEPQNIIEEFNGIWHKIRNLFSIIKNNNQIIEERKQNEITDINEIFEY